MPAVLLLTYFLFLICVYSQPTSNSTNTTNTTTAPTESTPRQRFGHSAILLPNRSMLIFGGHNYKYTSVEEKTYIGLKNDLWYFDLNTMTYSAIIPTRNTSVPPPRMHHTAVLLFDPNGIPFSPQRFFYFMFLFMFYLY
jgi:hypothetical protein